ncbi:MAG: response regulator receiver protein [Bacteroidetes bacterium]|jgi:CheY-like chemotaxis protein|nr:response regulator receiver protein [Bacteroidota bacterium]
MESKTLNCLLIDDDPDDQEIFCMALGDMGKEVNCTFANDGVDALKKLSENSVLPDFIFIDMNMPRMNGNECLAKIKEENHLKAIPVYMYSTSADPATVAETQRLGAAGFIVKPTSVSELTKTLKFCLK